MTDGQIHVHLIDVLCFRKLHDTVRAIQKLGKGVILGSDILDNE